MFNSEGAQQHSVVAAVKGAFGSIDDPFYRNTGLNFDIRISSAL